VEFVRAPAPGIATNLRDVLIGNGLRLAALDGQLAPDAEDVQGLVLTLIGSCVLVPGQAGRSIAGWRVAAAELEHRTQNWIHLIARFTTEEVRVTREYLLQLVNCAQGDSTDVHFVDTPALLVILDGYQRRGWQAAAAPTAAQGSEMWDVALQVNAGLEARFPDAVTAEHRHLRDRLARLEALLGDRAPKDVHEAIFDARSELARSRLAPNFDLWSIEKAQELESRLPELQAIGASDAIAQIAVRLSAGGAAIQVLMRSVIYLEGVASALDAVQRDLDGRIEHLEGETGITEQAQRAAQVYAEVISLLERITARPSGRDKTK
jgi:hypothetical protein